MLPLCLQYGADIILSGHDHNLQHISKTVGHDIDYIISGAGGRGLYGKDNAAEATLNGMGFTVDFFGYMWGFVYMDAMANAINIQYVDETGTVVYSFNRIK